MTPQKSCLCVIVATVMKVPWVAGAEAGAEMSLYTAPPYNAEFSLEISTQITPHPWHHHRHAFQGKPVLNRSGGEVWLCCCYRCLGCVLKLCVCTHTRMTVGVYVYACTHMYVPWYTWNSWLSSSEKLHGVRASIFFLYFQSFSLSFYAALLQLQWISRWLTSATS